MSALALQEASRGHWGALAGLLAPFRRRVLGLGLLAALRATIPLAGPLIMRAFIDGAVAGDSTTTLLWYASAYVAMAVVSQVLAVVVLWAATSLAWKVTDTARVELTDHLLRHDLAFHNKHTAGELVERVDGDLTAVSEHLASFAVVLLKVIFTVSGMLIIVSVLDWRVGIGLACYVAFAIGMAFWVKDLAVADSAHERGTMARLYGGIEERLVGLEDLRANGAGPHAMRRFEEDADAAKDAAIRRERAIVWLWHATSGAIGLGAVAALAVGAAGATMGWLSLGTAFLLFQYTQLLEIPLDEMAEQLQEVQKAAGGISRVSELLGDQPVDPPSTGPLIPEGPLELRYQNVHFSYGDEPVLQGVDLVVPAGTSLGLVGATGGGKSTLGRLTTRLLCPTSGCIQLAGVDVSAIGESDLRAAIGVVPQDVEIFSSTVRDNVTLFDRTIDDAAVTDALEQVGLAPKLLGGRHALDQNLTGEGGGLSAGEAQLLALSRVFLRNPGVVLLDEATSRVDPQTEQLVLDAVDLLLKDRTAVVIAHRMATLERVSHIAVLHNGQIQEQGPRAALLTQAGTYARLVALTAETETVQ